MESSEDLPMSPGGYIAAATVLTLIGFFGFSLNLIVIILFIREKQLRTPMNMVLLNLAISDLCVASLGNPLTLTAAVVRRWPFGPKMCVAYAFFMSFFGMASIGALSLLALERCVLVAQPLRRSAPTLRCALLALVGVWTYALALSAPPLAGWGAFGPEAANISCSVNWEKPDMNSTTYIAFLFILGLLLPVVIIGGSYVTIVRTMRRSSLRAGRALPRAERRLTMLVLVMATAFLVAWAPYAALALASAAARGPVASPAVAVLPALLAKSSVCYNPIIYVGLNSQFRAAWQRLLGVRPTARGSSQTAGGELTSFISPTRIVSRQVSTAAEHALAPPLIEAVNGSKKSQSPPRPPELTPLPPPPPPACTPPITDDGTSSQSPPISPHIRSPSGVRSPAEIISPTMTQNPQTSSTFPEANCGIRSGNFPLPSENKSTSLHSSTKSLPRPSESDSTTFQGHTEANGGIGSENLRLSSETISSTSRAQSSVSTPKPSEIKSSTLVQDYENISRTFPEHTEGNIGIKSGNSSVPSDSKSSISYASCSVSMPKPSETKFTTLEQDSESNSTSLQGHTETSSEIWPSSYSVPPENILSSNHSSRKSPSLPRHSKSKSMRLSQFSDINSPTFPGRFEVTSPMLETDYETRSANMPDPLETRSSTANPSSSTMFPSSERLHSALPQPSEIKSPTCLEYPEIRSPPMQVNYGILSPNFSKLSETRPIRRPSDTGSPTSSEFAEIKSPTLSVHFVNRPSTKPASSEIKSPSLKSSPEMVSPIFFHRHVSNTHPSVSRKQVASEAKQISMEIPNNCVQSKDPGSKSGSPKHADKELPTSQT